MGTPEEEFGPYVVYEQLGLGGMATVHRAETQGIAGFSKQVALKRMLPNVASNASLVKSFIREARLASHLRHENVAQTYDLGKVGETYFIAMELVPGHNLREILRHCAAVCGPMPLPIVLNIVTQLCDALDYAHNLCDEMGQPLGIIHRDVSPSNIIVNDGGVVKLIDFGIAKASSAGSNMNTMSGTIKGKFGYMAPEYLMGSIDSRADLFAIGVIAHELLANRPLFQGKDDMDTLYRVKDMPILPPSRINPKVPTELDSIVMTALDRNPDQRWQRANALRQALTTEIKRLSLVAHNAQVIDWIDTAFLQTSKKSQFDVDSEPLISISPGTMEMPRGATLGTPRREVPDEFSNAEGMETLVTSAARTPSARADEWNVATTSDAMEHPAGGDVDLPTQLLRKSAPQVAAPDPRVLDTRRDRSSPTARPSSPHVVSRARTGGGRDSGLRNTPVPQQEFDDDALTLAPRADRRELLKVDSTDDIATLPPRTERPSVPRIERQSEPPRSASQPSSLAPRSDAQARTMMIAPDRVERPSQPMSFGGPAAPQPRNTPPLITPVPVAAGLAGPSTPQVRTLPGAGGPSGGHVAIPSDPDSPAASGARTTPRMSGSEIAEYAGRGALDNLDARGVRPSAASLMREAQGSVTTTKVEPGKRSGASMFLLPLLVLIAAGAAAAVVYFALPYLT